MATQPQTQLPSQAAPPPTSLTIRDSDLAHALGTLRTTSAPELFAVRTLRIILTESNLLHWHGAPWPPWPGARAVFDDDDLDEYARLYPAPASSSTAGGSPSEAFRALLRFVAESFELGGLDLEVDAGSEAWSLFEDKAAGSYGGGRDEVDRNWGFVYDFHMDVGRALAEVFGGGKLRVLDIKTSIWDGIGAWLEGQINGRGTVVDRELPGYYDPRTPLLSRKGWNGRGDIDRGRPTEGGNGRGNAFNGNLRGILVNR